MASSSTSRRSTISAFRAVVPPSLPSPVSTKPGVCTHMTVTRLYTSEWTCSICHSVGGMGWVFRCTQDREHLLEHDLEVGCHDKIDDLCDALETSTSPKKRSAGARAAPLSLLDEITDKQLATYTPVQLATLLKQRGHLQSVLIATDILQFQSQQQYNHDLGQPLFQPANPTNTSPSSSNTPFQFPPTPSQLKPWIPLKECQFKACARCRPSFREKSYLSLNSIMNGDIPATASMGFGFHMMGSRPVADAETVKNLGLRPNPAFRKDSPSSSTSSPNLEINTQGPRNGHINVKTLNGASSGLGISTNGLEPTSLPNSIIRSNSPTNLIYSADDITSPSLSAVLGHDYKDNEQKHDENAMNYISVKDFAPRPSPKRRPTGYPSISVTSASESDDSSCDTILDSDSGSENGSERGGSSEKATSDRIPFPTPPLQLAQSDSKLIHFSALDALALAPTLLHQHRLSSASASAAAEIRAQVLAPDQASCEGEEDIAVTAVESHDIANGHLGSDPLIVKEGVAVTGEGAELQILAISVHT